MTTYCQNRFCPCVRCRMNSMLVPAILVAWGILLLLSNLHAASFHRTWPILLIVLGSIKVLQSSASTEGHRPPPVVTPAPPQTAAGASASAQASSTASSSTYTPE